MTPTFMLARMRSGLLIGLCLVVAGCTLPRSGPTISEITAPNPDGSPAVDIIEIDDRVALVSRIDEPLVLSPQFTSATIENIELIRPLDVLTITIWENTDTGLFGGLVGPTVLAEKRVDLSGHVFIPQVGRLQVAGLTIEQLRQRLTARLAEMTPEPQVEVSLVLADNNTVKVFGENGAIGEFPIEARTRTLSGLLANAAGSGIETEVAQVTIRRGGQVGRVWMEDVYRDPRADIALKGGDIILVERDDRSFRALGALGGNGEIDFPGRDISLMTALASLGGLNSATADPTGVFVLRIEGPNILNQIHPEKPVTTPQRVAYVMDLTKPAAFFTASNFYVRDDDIVYVTEAPYVQWLKIIGSIAPPINTVSSTSDLLTETFN
ncbi:polysaccharide export outer membrane protein [Rubricella aquisinus]|uniref:Polysaccharide export outer membrane protein n=1 Tax=Rubricella aquisinus TaxID=2028108 RepID=A0A840WLC6_9RHOB|nr:polysaccharide biosynthesis/export family protein [Rubricella aquisinus]MBB5515331.1 polysaccharide export outer membrane protein [Rubricella aquisinus]